MNDGVFGTGKGFKGFGNNVFARLGKNLDGDIVRDKIPFDKGTAEFVFGFAGGRKADLDLLKADADKITEKFELFFKAHRDDEGLVAVAQIHAAPDRCFVDAVFFHPFGVFEVCRKILFLVLLVAVHVLFSFLFAALCIAKEIYKEQRQAGRKYKKISFAQHKSAVQKRRSSFLRGTTLFDAMQ